MRDNAVTVQSDLLGQGGECSERSGDLAGELGTLPREETLRVDGRLGEPREVERCLRRKLMVRPLVASGEPRRSPSSADAASGDGRSSGDSDAVLPCVSVLFDAPPSFERV